MTLRYTLFIAGSIILGTLVLKEYYPVPEYLLYPWVVVVVLGFAAIWWYGVDLGKKEMVV